MIMICSTVFCNGALIYGLISLLVQAVIEKERRGDFLGKTVQVCNTIQIFFWILLSNRLFWLVITSIVLAFYVLSFKMRVVYTISYPYNYGGVGGCGTGCTTHYRCYSGLD